MIHSSLRKTIRSIDTNEVHQVLDGTTLNTDTIKKLIHLITGLPFCTAKCGKNQRLFRARINTKGAHFFKPSELRHPPPKIASAGRANKENSPVLYLGSDGRTALFESKLQNTSALVTVIEFRSTTSLNCQHIGLADRHPHFKAFKNQWRSGLNSFGFSASDQAKLQKIMDALARAFMSSDETSTYHLTSEISDTLLKYDRADGLLYPSKKSPNDWNLALVPARAAHKVEPIRADLFTTHTSQAGQLMLNHIDTSLNIDENSDTISWAGRPFPTLDWPTVRDGLTTKVPTPGPPNQIR